jgi:hypothetical protein
MSKSTVVGCIVVCGVSLWLVLTLSGVRAETQNAPVEETSSSARANADLSAAQELEPAEPEPAQAEKPPVTREQLLELFQRNTVPATDFESVTANHGHRLYNIMKAFPERDDYQRVIMDFVNLGRPQDENDVLARYGEEVLARDDEKERWRGLGAFLLELQNYSTDDIRLFSIAQRAIEEESGNCGIGMAKEAVIAIGMIRVPEAAIYLRKACRESYWEQLYKDRLESGKLSDYDIMYLRMSVAHGITNLPEDEALPLLNHLVSLTEIYYQSFCFRLDEMWRRKNGMPSIHMQGGYRHDFAVNPFQWTSVAHPQFLFGIRGKRVPKPFGEGQETYEVHVNIPGI